MSKHCDQCFGHFEEDDFLIVISEEDVVLHYGCWNDWKNEQFFSEEAKFKNGKVVPI